MNFNKITQNLDEYSLLSKIPNDLHPNIKIYCIPLNVGQVMGMNIDQTKGLSNIEKYVAECERAHADAGLLGFTKCMQCKKKSAGYSSEGMLYCQDCVQHYRFLRIIDDIVNVPLMLSEKTLFCLLCLRINDFQSFYVNDNCILCCRKNDLLTVHHWYIKKERILIRSAIKKVSICKLCRESDPLIIGKEISYIEKMK